VDGRDATSLVAAGLTLLQRSAPLVRALQGRRAAILLPTTHRFLTALAASEGRGAVLVNPLAAPAEIAHQLRDANVGAVLTVAALAPRLPHDTPHVLLDESPRRARVVTPAGHADVDLGSHYGLDLEGDPDVAGRDEEAAIVYTSAMAGRPLGAILTHRNLLANARSTLGALKLGAHDHSLAILPFSHLFGLVVSAIAPLLAGARVTTMERFNPVRAIEALEREGITMMVGVPSVFAVMVGLLERRGEPLRPQSPALFICGGAPLAVELQERWLTATGTELRQGYGLTEAGPVCLFNHVDQQNRRGWLGYPLPHVDVAVRSPDGLAFLPDGEEGEIVVRGDNVFPGYVSDGGAGLAVRDGWLHTGDLGVRDSDGAFAFRGVRKAMFTRNGFNIYPREIERAVSEMPGVRRVRVRAVPDPVRENEIALEVEGDVREDDVKAWCAERLAAYKQPAGVAIIA
jgi:long-chain acyl-CoA synthetase